VKRLACLLFLAALSVAPATHAATVRSYELRITPGPDAAGRAVAVVTLDGATPGPVALPVGFARVSGLHLEEAPAGTTVTSEPQGGQTLVHATLPPATPAVTVLKFGFTVEGFFRRPAPTPGEKATLPAGGFLLRHAVMNSQPETIGRYLFEVTFPANLRAHAIREALPKLRKTESVPRVRLDAIDGQAGARLQVNGLAQGMTTSVQIEMAPRSRSLAWLVAGLVLSVLYLVYFRDLVSRRAR
jgi:hypothetical protein